jgi:hypothetical protein
MDDEKKKVDPILRVATIVIVLAAAVVLIGALDGQSYSNSIVPRGRGHSARLISHQADGHPYSYYTMLRWLACSAAVVLIWRGNVQGVKWAWAFVPLVILFNPIAPIHFSRDAWQILDIATAVAMVLAVIIMEKAILLRKKQ